MTEIEERIDELENRATELRRKKSEIQELVDRWRAERDRLNESSRAIRDEAAEHREERDRMNERVAELKDKLQPLLRELEEKRRVLEAFQGGLREDKEGLPNKRRVESAFRRVEWEAMTTPTREMLEREDELIERAKGLKRTLEEFDEVERKEDASIGMIAETKAKELEIRRIREEMRALSEKSQENHEAMITLYEKADKEKRKADDAHANFVESLKEVEAINDEFDGVMLEMNALRSGLRVAELKEKEERRKGLKAVLDGMRLEAHRKLEAGEKLTFEEMKLIYGEVGEDEEEEE